MVMSNWRRFAILVLIVGVGLAIGLYYYADRLVEQRLRPATIALLERRFDSKVELASLNVSLNPQLSVRGEGLTIRHQGRTDVPPLISMRAFTRGACSWRWSSSPAARSRTGSPRRRARGPRSST